MSVSFQSPILSANLSTIIALYVHSGIVAASNICCWSLYFRMDISAVIAEYLQKTTYKNWRFASCLHYVASKCSLTSQHKQEVKDELKRQLQHTADHVSVSQWARNKATKFIGNIDKVFQTEEITMIFQYLDVKVSVIFFFIKRFFFRVIHNK